MNDAASILLLVAFISSFALALSLYIIAGRISLRGVERRSERTIPYACGEDPPPTGETRINCERFFIFTISFMIFDVYAFMIAISYSAPIYLPMLYSLITMMAIILLLISERTLKM
ncbi:hypothetical protein DRO64_11585 [Candidatus Bathyarchaeota archaeon]|nr:MAG: hypothetical protein DRO64_11585 [Candidatus Bathyarchaeota archaeon]